MPLTSSSAAHVKRVACEPTELVDGGMPAMDLQVAVEKALPILNNLYAVIEVYGLEKNARRLFRVIQQLEAALAPCAGNTGHLTFLVNARFSVDRLRDAQLLRLAYRPDSWFKIIAQKAPEELEFRTDREEV